MGAGASAASMSLEDRRALYQEVKSKYTRADLDALEDEARKAWLEVLTERERADLPRALGDGDDKAVPDNAATALCRGRGSVDISGGDGSTIRPQRRSTRMSYHLVSEQGEADASGMPNGPIFLEGEDRGNVAGETATVGVLQGPSRRLSADTPAWKRTSVQVESPVELSVGDVVKARDTATSNGMWFEGVLTAIHDEFTFTVELTCNDQSEDMDCITVGINDLVRVMPWFCIEVDDIVEFQTNESRGWFRGVVVDIDSDKLVYDVELDSDSTHDEAHETVEVMGGGEWREEWRSDEGDGKEEAAGRSGVIYRVADDRIRKICSGRQAVAKRWKRSVQDTRTSE